ncbi:MAG: quinol monooxygenase YgiN [Verrucomicrobiales bacterium]|jgi:quinol monooxygenase YgiN
MINKLFALFAAMSVLTGNAAVDDHIGDFRHVVLFKFNEDATPEQIKNIEVEFGKLRSKIDTIIDYEWGTTETVEEGLDQGYTHCFVVTFKDKAGLEVYLPHPDHKAFVTLIKPLLAEVHVFDYTAKN